MTTLSDEDIINSGIIAVKNSMTRKEAEIEKAKENCFIVNKQATELRKVKDQLIRQRKSLDADLSRAKKELSKLKVDVWKSDNPNVVELRNQLLVAAKLIKD